MNYKVNRHLPEFLLAALFILVLFIFIMGKARSGMAMANRTKCVSNVHQLAQAIQVYAMDHGRLPAGPGWHELVTAGTLSVGLLACPQRPEEPGYGYGMNWRVAALEDSRIPLPAETILLADVRNSTSDVWWVNDIRFLRLGKNRVPQDCHVRRAVFGFCDGHVKTMNHLDVTEQQWGPAGMAGKE